MEFSDYSTTLQESYQITRESKDEIYRMVPVIDILLQKVGEKRG